MNNIRKRSFHASEAGKAAMIEQQPTKRHRARIVRTRLSSEETRAIETVAKLMNKPVSEFYDEDDLQDTGIDTESRSTGDSLLEEVVNAHGESWPVPNSQWQPISSLQQNPGVDEPDVSTTQPGEPWTSASATTFEESYTTNIGYNQWPHGNKDTSGIDSTEEIDAGSHDVSSQRTLYPTPHWSNNNASDNSWLDITADFEIGSMNASGVTQSPGASARSDSGSYGPSQNMGTQYGSFDRNLSSSNATGNDNIEVGWEDIRPQGSICTGQLTRLASNNTPGYSMSDQAFVLDKSTPKSVEWIPVDPADEEASSQRPHRRGPFQDQKLREETSNTRKLKACVRCRMQKIRCQINTNDPSGICQTCQDVSKQKIHTLPCMRYKLTECTLYRIGKAPGLEFTFRWPVMKLKDITNWSDNRIRTIKVLSDVCPVPLELSVRKFVPIPQDSVRKSWMDGTVKKFKTTTPFAIVNMNAAKIDLNKYINDNVFVCMDYWLRDRDEIIKETFTYARAYMRKAPEDEQHLIASYMRLWMASRRTATTESIIGDDTLDMEPETIDSSYPLFGKVPLPPVMIQQLDMILTLGFLQPLRKKVLDQFNRIVLKNNPKSWMTIYLVTFMSLQSCAAFTAENYQNARKHGLKRRFSMPTFIAERHHSSNVFLSHYHYCTKPCDPFKIDWRKRHTTQFADMTTDEIEFILRTSEMVKARKDKFRHILDFQLYEDDLYFVSQMFEDDWAPRDTVIETGDETITGGPLKEYGSPPKSHGGTS